MMKNLIVFLLIILTSQCNNPASSDSIVIASEKWVLYEPRTPNEAYISICKLKNGNIACTGKWLYKFSILHTIYNTTCNITEGTVQKDSSYFEFKCTGLASYPPDCDGHIDSSAFSMIMSGQFKDGNCSGKWSISFGNELWISWAPEGNFRGKIVEGSGISD